MRPLTLQIHHNQRGWLDAATIQFVANGGARLEYDIDYVAEFVGHDDRFALSVAFPVDLKIYDGPVPGFILDLIPQGDPLKRLLRRYGLPDTANFEQILSAAPLAPPGNIRLKEPWTEIEAGRPDYRGSGFTRADVVERERDFIDYMESAGAPIGGTTGAGGGSPKFLLREDANGRLHAEGWLEDSRTRRCILVKLPYTDSENARMLARVEKVYYDLLRSLPVRAGAAIDILEDTLFITRFDRTQTGSGQFLYHGLESLYSAHNINVHGALLKHEDNLRLIGRYSSNVTADTLEYLSRDILNQMLANTDNHGRNTSLLKTESGITLSPVYDVTAMQFFSGDFISELTRWTPDLATLEARIKWTANELKLDETVLRQGLSLLSDSTRQLDGRMKDLGVPEQIVRKSASRRAKVQSELEAMT